MFFFSGPESYVFEENGPNNQLYKILIEKSYLPFKYLCNIYRHHQYLIAIHIRP